MYSRRTHNFLIAFALTHAVLLATALALVLLSAMLQITAIGIPTLNLIGILISVEVTCGLTAGCMLFWLIQCEPNGLISKLVQSIVERVAK